MTRIIFAILAIFGTVTYAELPTPVADTKVQQSLEYLDQKTNNLANITASGNTTTLAGNATISGTIDIGLVIVSNTVTSSTSTATCPSGKKILGGGCAHPTTAYSQGYPGTDTSFTCALSDTLSNTAYAICARVK